MNRFNMNKKNIIIIILALVAMNVSFTCKANDGWETIKIDRRVSDYAFKGIDQSHLLPFPCLCDVRGKNGADGERILKQHELFGVR